MLTPELYKDIFEQIDVSTIITDEKGFITTVNPSYLTLSGFTNDEVINKHIECYLDGQMDTSTPNKNEIYVKKKNGCHVIQWLSVKQMRETKGDKRYHIWMMTDIQVSGLDPLTNLPNRLLFNQELNKSIHQSRREESIFAVLFLDLDRFKFVNDTLGHSYGDILLQQAAGRIKSAIGNSNVIARMGGDEFVCIIENLNDEKEAEVFAKRIISSFSDPFTLKETEIFITTSIGISLCPFDGDDVETLITNADNAMYRAKKKGRNQYEKARVDINAGSFEKLLIENNLRKALKEEEFSLYYQPQINLKANRMSSLEALIRWNHPDLGIVYPNEFIPIAEETGLILPIGEWVLRTACIKMKEWQNAGFPPVRVAVNLSALQFLQNDLVTTVKNVLIESGLNPTFLELEITEEMIMHDMQKAIDVLKKLKEIGVSISIDDFGTGYSSLNYLKEFPVDNLKIDRSFIVDIDKNSKSVALTKAIATLAHDLNLKVIAEGVENDKQLSMIKQFSCDIVQGYYFSKPISYDHLVQYFLHDYKQAR